MTTAARTDRLVASSPGSLARTQAATAAGRPLPTGHLDDGAGGAASTLPPVERS
ncbi:MAG: hypothetical protein ACLQOZ_07360 [Acidimicrobiales bacterium]